MLRKVFPHIEEAPALCSGSSAESPPPNLTQKGFLMVRTSAGCPQDGMDAVFRSSALHLSYCLLAIFGTLEVFRTVMQGEEKRRWADVVRRKGR